MDAEADEAQARGFFGALRGALLELQTAYERLLKEIGAQFIAAMDLPEPLEAGRAEAAQRAAALKEHVTEQGLRAYVGRLCDRTLADREWQESLAALLVRKAPKSWTDDDLLAYGIELSALAAQFKRVEEIVTIEAPGAAPSQSRRLRVAVTEPSGEERRELVSILPGEESAVEAVAKELEMTLHEKKLAHRVRLAAVTELARRLLQDEAGDVVGGSDEQS